MLKLINISKSFEEKSVINGFSFEFPERGLVTVTGESGKGKTTLLNIIAGLLKQDGGSVENGYPSLSYYFQDDRLFPWLSAKRNIEIALDGVANKKECAEYWLDVMELSEFADHIPDKLSGGMKQRVALARALAYPSKLVLLDEPFSSVDEELHKKLYEVIKKEAKERLVIMVTHDPADVSEINIEI